MTNDARITELMLRYSSEFGFDTHAFARAVWSLGRDAGLEEAVAVCKLNDLRHAAAVVRALKEIKENKNDR